MLRTLSDYFFGPFIFIGEVYRVADNMLGDRPILIFRWVVWWIAWFTWPLGPLGDDIVRWTHEFLF